MTAQAQLGYDAITSTPCKEFFVVCIELKDAASDHKQLFYLSENGEGRYLIELSLTSASGYPTGKAALQAAQETFESEEMSRFINQHFELSSVRILRIESIQVSNFL